MTTVAIDIPPYNKDAEVAQGTICPLCGQDTAINDEGIWEVCPHLLLNVDVTFPYACGLDCPCEPVGLGSIPTEPLVALNEAIRAFFGTTTGNEEVARCIVSFPPDLAVLILEIEQGVTRERETVIRDDYVDLASFAGLYHRVLGGCSGYYGWTSWEQDIPISSSEYWLFWGTGAPQCASAFLQRIKAFTELLWVATKEMR